MTLTYFVGTTALNQIRKEWKKTEEKTRKKNGSHINAVWNSLSSSVLIFLFLCPSGNYIYTHTGLQSINWKPSCRFIGGANVRNVEENAAAATTSATAANIYKRQPPLQHDQTQPLPPPPKTVVKPVNKVVFPREKTPPKVPEKSPIKSSKNNNIASKKLLTPSTPQLKKQQQQQQQQSSKKLPEVDKNRHLNTKHIKNSVILTETINNMPRMRYESTTSAESLPHDSQLKSHRSESRTSKKSKKLNNSGNLEKSNSNVTTEKSNRHKSHSSTDEMLEK